MSNLLYFRIEGPLSPIRQVAFDGDLVLGSGPECGLVLPHGTVAAHHARITGTRDRLLLSSLGPPTSVRRAGSVFVVRAGIPFPLLVGDQLGLGEVRVQLMPPPEAEAGRRVTDDGRRHGASGPVPAGREVPEARAGGTRMVERSAVERPERADRRSEPPAPAVPTGRRPRGVTRVVDVRGEARPRPVEPRPEPHPEPRPVEPRPVEPRRLTEPPPRPPTERPPTERLPTERPPTERLPTERPPTERPPTERPLRAVPSEPPREPPRRTSVALRSAAIGASDDDRLAEAQRSARALRAQPTAARRPDPLEDGPTGFFSRAAVRAPTEVPRTLDEKAKPAPDGAARVAERLALEHEVAALEAAFEAQGGRVREQRRRSEQRAAVEAALQAQQRPLQAAERALAAARVELAAHEHELATHERRCRELEAQIARLRARREGAEARRDESVRRLRDAEQARDTAWQTVWSLEHEQLRLEGLIDNLELALGVSPKRG